MPRAYSGANYHRTYLPDHPLAQNANKIVLTHRLILFEQYPNGAPCHWCGKDLFWFRSPRLVGDHLDTDITNNDPLNLVPSCRGCNGNRTKASPQHGTISGYQHLKCREPCCKEVWSAQMREYRAQRKAAGNPVRH